MAARDYQKSRVYAWEWDTFRTADKSQVPYAQAQGLVDYIWTNEGLQFAPKVTEMNARVTRWAGMGNRTHIWLPSNEASQTSVIVHEVAHAMTSGFDGDSGQHGPEYVGLYMKLLAEYMKIPMFKLMFTAKKHNVDFDLTAKPFFVD